MIVEVWVVVTKHGDRHYCHARPPTPEQFAKWKREDGARLFRLMGEFRDNPIGEGPGRRYTCAGYELTDAKEYENVSLACEESKETVGLAADGLPIPRYSIERHRMTRCQCDDDGYCGWEGCPQRRDGEPDKTGRHCPLDQAPEDDDV